MRTYRREAATRRRLIAVPFDAISVPADEVAGVVLRILLDRVRAHGLGEFFEQGIIAASGSVIGIFFDQCPAVIIVDSCRHFSPLRGVVPDHVEPRVIPGHIASIVRCAHTPLVDFPIGTPFLLENEGSAMTMPYQ
jgi:hypothetical protein